MTKKDTHRETSTKIKKGTLLSVKAPPFYSQEYTYQVTGSGDKIIRADLLGSPTVRKSWTTEELSLLLELGMVTILPAKDIE